MKKALVVLLLPILIIFFIFKLVSREKEDVSGIRTSPGSYMESIKIVHKLSGSEDWSLTAERADFLKNDEADLTGITILTKKEGMTIQAENGKYYLVDGRFAVAGTVVARNESMIITASDVDYDSESGVLSSSGEVTVTGRKFSLRGTGMRLQNYEQTIRISDDVHATFYR